MFGGLYLPLGPIVVPKTLTTLSVAKSAPLIAFPPFDARFPIYRPLKEDEDETIDPVLIE